MAKEQNDSLRWLPVHMYTITFIVLKLCKVIDWSWWWVLSPLWINILTLIFGYIIIVIYDKRKRRNQCYNVGESVEARRDLKDEIEKLQQELEKRYGRGAKKDS